MYGQTDDKVELNRIVYYWFLRALQRHLVKRRCRAPVNERLLLARVLYSHKFWLTHNRNLLVRHSALTPIPPKATEFRAPLRNGTLLAKGEAFASSSAPRDLIATSPCSRASS